MDLTGFYATVSGVGFTLLGLWWVVVDKHPEWFGRRGHGPDGVRRLAAVHHPGDVLAALAGRARGALRSGGPWSSRCSAWSVSPARCSMARAARPPGHDRGMSVLVLVLALPVYAGMVLVALVPEVGRAVRGRPGSSSRPSWSRWCSCSGCTRCGSSATTGRSAAIHRERRECPDAGRVVGPGSQVSTTCEVSPDVARIRPRQDRPLGASPVLRDGPAHPQPRRCRQRPDRAQRHLLRAARRGRPDHHRGHRPQRGRPGLPQRARASTPSTRSPAGAWSPTRCTARAAPSWRS